MSAKIPDDAFERYYAQGANRSYQALADELGVSKRAVSQRATKENWQGLVEEREQKTRKAVANRVEQSVENLRERHARVLKALQGKALEALRGLSLTRASDVIRALEVSIKAEQQLFGPPGGASAMEVAIQIREALAAMEEIEEGESTRGD